MKDWKRNLRCNVEGNGTGRERVSICGGKRGGMRTDMPTRAKSKK